MSMRVPYYGDLVNTIADLVDRVPVEVSQKARQIVKDSQSQVPTVAGWVPMIDIPRNEWEYLANERAIGEQIGWMLLARTADVLKVYNNPKNEFEEAIYSRLLNVKDWQWIVLSVG